MDLLLDAQSATSDEPFIHAKAIQIEKTLEEFGIPARVAGYRVGPTIIQYAVEPGYVEKVNDEGDIVRKKVRVSQISGLNRDLTLALGVDRLRIEAPIPGHSFVGIEIPNTSSSLVRLKTILNSNEFKAKPAPLNMALGLNVSGAPVIADLMRMPHMLVAGTTGSGKSVCITSLIACLVMNNTPEDLRIAILDPKMVELLRFNGLPHLMGKVETQLDRMLGVLAWAIKEMDDRYKKLEAVNARDLDAYNAKMARRGGEHLPKIVIFIDELADLMLSAPDSTEGYLVRLAQMARATGIHMVVATQRPSTDIITGLIKANFPARISFMMASSVDSRVILDTNGAETLMGRGDMLFLDPETAGLKRAQAVLIDDREIENIIAYWKNAVQEEMPEEEPAPWEGLVPSISDDSDDLIEAAIKLVRQEGRASTSRLQRKLRIGFPRAARLMDELEERGVVGPVESGGREREVIFDESPDDEEELY
jgi:S-DNA-T family DNA segregation ATPase FtsK/SpoIIIE